MIIAKSPFRISADNFSEKAELYLLSHFHSDHYHGMEDLWQAAPIVCSPVTASLLDYYFGVKDVLILNPGESLKRGSVKVSAYEANHCPGALIFMLSFRGGERTVYTGDFRFDEGLMAKSMEEMRGADELFADSTFLSCEEDFPAQEDAIEEIISIAESAIDEKKIIVGTYTIGKNKILRALYKRFGKRIYVTEDNSPAYRLCGDEELVTTDKSEADIYFLSRFYLERYYSPKDEELVIMPTGMSGREDYRRMNNKGFRWVRYSEHCSQKELKRFVELIDAKRVIYF